jgi:uncharacterized protein YndB with AHSA1/START domain
MRFSTRTTIHAPAARVWSILTDLAAWPTWNSTVAAVEGTVGLGQKVKVTVTANPGRAFPVKVSALESPTRMVWTGGMPLGLFTGTRTFTLRETEGVTEFSMDEIYTGPLSGLVTRSIPDLAPSFEEFARCLKATSESTVTS